MYAGSFRYVQRSVENVEASCKHSATSWSLLREFWCLSGVSGGLWGASGGHFGTYWRMLGPIFATSQKILFSPAPTGYGFSFFDKQHCVPSSFLFAPCQCSSTISRHPPSGIMCYHSSSIIYCHHASINHYPSLVSTNNQAASTISHNPPSVLIHHQSSSMISQHHPSPVSIIHHSASIISQHHPPFIIHHQSSSFISHHDQYVRDPYHCLCLHLELQVT